MSQLVQEETIYNLRDERDIPQQLTSMLRLITKYDFEK